LIRLNFVHTRANERERQLDISVPKPMVSRLNIDVRTDKEILRDKALKLQAQGLGRGRISKELGITEMRVRSLLKTNSEGC
jgi:hypothetical protein